MGLTDYRESPKILTDYLDLRIILADIDNGYQKI